MTIFYKLPLGESFSFGQGYVLPEGAEEISKAEYTAELDASRAPLAETLEQVKDRLRRWVDTSAETERKKYITPGEGQAMTYQRKVEEAKRAILEEEPATADYPMLAASVGVDGETVKEIAAIVLAMDAGWAVIGSGIEKIRLTAKKAIDEAVSVETANAVVEAIVWPEGAAS